MNTLNECLLFLDSDKLDIENRVTILEVLLNRLDIDTVSGMSRKENKSPNGIRESNRYRKVMIGCQKMVVKGVNDSKLPF